MNAAGRQTCVGASPLREGEGEVEGERWKGREVEKDLDKGASELMEALG